jgi:hypothetical protein
VIYLAAVLFLGGLAASFGSLLRFEGRVRADFASGEKRMPDRAAVGATLRRLIASSLVSGIGLGMLGMTAFIWGRSGPPVLAAYLWAALFIVAATFGWMAIVVIAFMARVNTLERYLKK